MGFKAYNNNPKLSCHDTRTFLASETEEAIITSRARCRTRLKT